MKSLETPRVVLDTNVILNALSKKLPYQHVLRSLLNGEYMLCLTNDILLEYEEKVGEFYNPLTASTFLEALSASTHVHKFDVFFQFNLTRFSARHETSFE